MTLATVEFVIPGVETAFMFRQCPAELTALTLDFG